MNAVSEEIFYRTPLDDCITVYKSIRKLQKSPSIFPFNTQLIKFQQLLWLSKSKVKKILKTLKSLVVTFITVFEGNLIQIWDNLQASLKWTWCKYKTSLKQIDSFQIYKQAYKQNINRYSLIR